MARSSTNICINIYLSTSSTSPRHTDQDNAGAHSTGWDRATQLCNKRGFRIVSKLCGMGGGKKHRTRGSRVLSDAPRAVIGKKLKRVFTKIKTFFHFFRPAYFYCLLFFFRQIDCWTTRAGENRVFLLFHIF